MTDSVDVDSQQVEALNRLRTDLIQAAKLGDIKEVGRISGALHAIRAGSAINEIDRPVGPLILSAEQRRDAGILVFEALHEKIPNSNFSIVVSQEANCAGSPVVVVTLPSLLIVPPE